ncbi:MAG: uridine phosphorylase [Negativicutes bacterium]|jgi:uridine phosphorylase
MHYENINHKFLDGVINGEYSDYYYHLGVSSADPILEKFRDVRAIVVAGSGDRIKEFAEIWSKKRNAEIIALPKEERFVTRYVDGVIFASHGMGMPSAGMCIQELMRMIFFLKNGDMEEMNKIFWTRVGTSGGVGLEGGTVVVCTEGIMADMKPYRVLIGEREQYFDGTFPIDIAQAIVDASKDSGINIVMGKTVAGNEFFLEQMRLDGAIVLAEESWKYGWLNWIFEKGVRNIEMEGAQLAGFLNYWGFSRFAMICTVILNRMNGDQVTSTPEELHKFGENSGAVLFNYLDTIFA